MGRCIERLQRQGDAAVALGGWWFLDGAGGLGDDLGREQDCVACACRGLWACAMHYAACALLMSAGRQGYSATVLTRV